jgi:hypothetical protein
MFGSDTRRVVVFPNITSLPAAPFRCILIQQSSQSTMQQQMRTVQKWPILLLLGHSKINSWRWFCIKRDSTVVNYQCLTTGVGLLRYCSSPLRKMFAWNGTVMERNRTDTVHVRDTEGLSRVCLSVCLLWVLCVVQVEVCASVWSLVQSSPTEYVVSECDLSVMSVVCCASRGQCVGLITRPEESYRVCCVYWSVIVKPRQWGGPGPLGAVAPWKKYFLVSGAGISCNTDLCICFSLTVSTSSALQRPTRSCCWWTVWQNAFQC